MVLLQHGMPSASLHRSSLILISHTHTHPLSQNILSIICSPAPTPHPVLTPQDGREIPDDVLVPLMVLAMVDASVYTPPVPEVRVCLCVRVSKRCMYVCDSSEPLALTSPVPVCS